MDKTIIDGQADQSAQTTKDALPVQEAPVSTEAPLTNDFKMKVKVELTSCAISKMGFPPRSLLIQKMTLARKGRFRPALIILTSYATRE
ncbi:MAG: hypothetical protein LBT38_07355 [Deltaproteobacteria bacterium]|jgi:hypothetical protein|nr:hypothetical protein [Deltaproteobacteria bacterium]